MQINYLKHNEIDYERWDDCVVHAVNALIYAQSWYLDVVSPAWEALVAGDYEYVMPLPRKRRYGIAYLVQPPLVQQLGIFSRNEITEKITDCFIRKIPYLSYHLNLNECNAYAQATVLPNYVLNLNRTYEELHAGFSKNTRRNIKKAREHNLSVRRDLTPQEFLDFYYGVEKIYPEPNKQLITKLLKSGWEKGKLKLYGILNQERRLIAALCLLCDDKRLTYLLPASNEEGKSKSAMFLMIDEILKMHAESLFVFDFEGSRIEGIARFYQGFGGEKKEYYGVKRLHP